MQNYDATTKAHIYRKRAIKQVITANVGNHYQKMASTRFDATLRSTGRLMSAFAGVMWIKVPLR